MDARNPDEIVVAGLTPNKRRNSPFDSNHRGNSLILLIDLAILGYLAYLLADAGRKRAIGKRFEMPFFGVAR